MPLRIVSSLNAVSIVSHTTARNLLSSPVVLGRSMAPEPAARLGAKQGPWEGTEPPEAAPTLVEMETLVGRVALPPEEWRPLVAGYTLGPVAEACRALEAEPGAGAVVCRALLAAPGIVGQQESVACVPQELPTVVVLHWHTVGAYTIEIRVHEEIFAIF
uniref:Uncharacterized protein n=1 Tax=Opuntia streptacantha TaxID=393608 RepID=A0A7C8ZQZ9_OPUST